MNHLSAGHKDTCPLGNTSCRLDKSCGPYEACHLHEACRLYREIPRSMLDKLWADNHNEVDMDYTFLGFEDVYAAVTQFVPKSKTILDLGCAYGTQAWFFREYKQYIGVEGSDIIPMETQNSLYFTKTSIQDFISVILPKLNLNMEEIFAVCSYVDDETARELVRKTFPHCLVYYP